MQISSHQRPSVCVCVALLCEMHAVLALTARPTYRQQHGPDYDCRLPCLCQQYRATHRQEGAHEEGIWSVCWTAKDQILSGSVDERARVW
jgi:hypothetical protein